MTLGALASDPAHATLVYCTVNACIYALFATAGQVPKE
jgi:hypothetical protein